MSAEPWPFTDDELHAMAHATSGVRTSDEEKVAYWTERAGGPEVVERARERAVEIVAHAGAAGTLDLLAESLSCRSYLSGGEVLRILQTKGAP